MEVLDYSPETGELRWKVSLGSCKAGQVAGYKAPIGYTFIRVDGKRYCAHRLIYKMMTGTDPTCEIDHINGNKGDNRWSNLREATCSQNLHNIRTKKGKRCLGIYFHKPAGKWVAQIGHQSRTLNLGLYDCPLMAGLAYLDAKAAIAGEFNPF